MVKEKIIVFFCLCFCHLVGVFADELKSVSVMEGHSVSLNSSLTEIQKDEKIMWRFGPNRSLIARTDGVNNMIPEGLDERFRHRLQLDNKTGSLTIMNIRTDHTGVYEVEISGSSSSSTHRFNVTVYAAPTAPTSTSASSSASTSASASSYPLGSPNPTALISAAAAAGFLLLILAVVIFFIFLQKLSIVVVLLKL